MRFLKKIVFFFRPCNLISASLRHSDSLIHSLTCGPVSSSGWRSIVSGWVMKALGVIDCRRHTSALLEARDVRLNSVCALAGHSASEDMIVRVLWLVDRSQVPWLFDSSFRYVMGVHLGTARDKYVCCMTALLDVWQWWTPGVAGSSSDAFFGPNSTLVHVLVVIFSTQIIIFVELGL